MNLKKKIIRTLIYESINNNQIDKIQKNKINKKEELNKILY
jgi:hypothetical protein